MTRVTYYLTANKAAALGLHLPRVYGLEVPLDWVEPRAELLPDTRPDTRPGSLYVLFRDGGTHWPARWKLEWPEAPARAVLD